MGLASLATRRLDRQWPGLQVSAGPRPRELNDTYCSHCACGYGLGSDSAECLEAGAEWAGCSKGAGEGASPRQRPHPRVLADRGTRPPSSSPLPLQASGGTRPA